MIHTIRIAVAVGLATVATVHADPVMFSHAGTGSGSIGGVNFTNADFVITATGNTTNRNSFSVGWYIEHATASIDIAGVGTFDFTSLTRTFVNNSTERVGFARAPGTDLFNGPTDPIFVGWDMLSSIGPVTGSGVLLVWSSPPVNTSGGVLIFNRAGTTATFSATVIPAPAGVALLGLGGIVAARRRR